MSLYGLIIGIALVVGINYFENHQNVIPKNKLTLFIVGLVTFAIVGARAYHVADTWWYYRTHLYQILQTWKGGLGIFGGIIGSFVFISFFAFFHKLSLLKIIDFITPILPLCQSIGRFGNFVNGEIPIWWLESLLCFFLYLFIRKFPKYPTSKYLIGYGLIRFADEFARSDTWVINHVKIAQVESLLFIIIGLLLYFRKKTTIKS